MHAVNRPRYAAIGQGQTWNSVYFGEGNDTDNTRYLSP